ncbi:hypothetical protein [Oryzifoliimicrobium ureilyticus]|uniref:hypothetical protein n=1 Tax=Oryzifoliimicrobium ureilyticus TaxID=3113724 RepID=UPI0030766187
MKASVVTSGILHGTLLAFMLVTLGAPEPMMSPESEAVPVDIVQADAVAQGDDKAPAKEKPAPKPTERPDNNESAENLGDNKTDIKAPPVPNAKPTNSDAVAPPKPSEKPQPENDPTPNEVKDVAKEDTDTVEQKQAASQPPPQPAIPTPPKPEEKPQEDAEPPKPDAEALPDKVPTPVVKPQPKPPEQKPVEKPAEKPQDQQKATETASDKKKADQKQQKAKSTNSPKSDFNANEIAALLDKRDPSAGGAKRSTQTASLGAKKALGTALSSNEIDGIKGQIEGNWNMTPGMPGVEEVRVQVVVQLDQQGNVVGRPEVTATGGPDSTRRAVEFACLRAVMRSSPLKNLPAGKYDGETGWNTMTLNFDPSDFAL